MVASSQLHNIAEEGQAKVAALLIKGGLVLHPTKYLRCGNCYATAAVACSTACLQQQLLSLRENAAVLERTQEKKEKSMPLSS